MLSAYQIAHLVHDIDREGSVRDDQTRESVMTAHEDASSVILMGCVCSPDGVDAELVVLLCWSPSRHGSATAARPCMMELSSLCRLRPTFLERHGCDIGCRTVGSECTCGVLSTALSGLSIVNLAVVVMTENVSSSEISRSFAARWPQPGGALQAGRQALAGTSRSPAGQARHNRPQAR